MSAAGELAEGKESDDLAAAAEFVLEGVSTLANRSPEVKSAAIAQQSPTWVRRRVRALELKKQ